MFDRSSDDDGLESIARRLEVEPTEGAVLAELDRLGEAADSLAAAVPNNDLPVAPDASAVEKVAAVAGAAGDELSTDASAGNSGVTRESATDSAVADVAADLNAHYPARSETSRSLLSAVAGTQHRTRAEYRRLLERVVDELDARQRVGEELPASPTAAGATLEGAARELERLDDTAAERAAALARELSDRESDAATSDDIGDLVETLSALFKEEFGETVSGATTEDRLRSLIAATERGIGHDDCGGVEERDERVGVDEQGNRGAVDECPDSEPRGNRDGPADSGARVRRCNELVDACADIRSPVASAVRERVESLRDGDGGRSAVESELAFYEDLLLPALEPPDESVDKSVESVSAASLADRRADLVRRHVEAKGDHNHSIPLYLFELTETLEDRVRELNDRGDPALAAGVHEACEAILDAIEGLYEQNEYSVMLRRLRG